MITIELLPISNILINIAGIVINWIIGWFIIERIRMFLKGRKTRKNWNNYYDEQSQDYRDNRYQ